MCSIIIQRLFHYSKETKIIPKVIPKKQKIIPKVIPKKQKIIPFFVSIYIWYKHLAVSDIFCFNRLQFILLFKGCCYNFLGHLHKCFDKVLKVFSENLHFSLIEKQELTQININNIPVSNATFFMIKILLICYLNLCLKSEQSEQEKTRLL